MAETMRRLPAQQRSREKVQRILDAAEELLATVGYDRAAKSPTKLLEACGVSRGAFYAYFTSPEMAVETVALGFIERATEMADEFAAKDYASWRELVEHTIDVYAGYYREPAVRAQRSPVAGCGGRRRNRQPLHRRATLRHAAARGCRFSGALHVSHCSVAIEILDYLLRFAFRREPGGDDMLIREAKDAMVAYLGTKMDVVRDQR